MKTPLLTLIIATMSLSGFLSASEPLAVGDAAPALTVTVDSGKPLDLATTYAAGPVLLFFYPKADTRGCTAQACNLRDSIGELRAAGIQVIGVSMDDVASQAAFREKYGLPYPLVADADKALGKAFRVGNYLGAAYKRQTFLVVNGRIAWRDLAAKPATQSEDALQAWKGLGEE
jgi:peroxiredoxin Q/BCP